MLCKFSLHYYFFVLIRFHKHPRTVKPAWTDEEQEVGMKATTSTTTPKLTWIKGHLADELHSSQSQHGIGWNKGINAQLSKKKVIVQESIASQARRTERGEISKSTNTATRRSNTWSCTYDFTVLFSFKVFIFLSPFSSSLHFPCIRRLTRQKCTSSACGEASVRGKI